MQIYCAKIGVHSFSSLKILNRKCSTVITLEKALDGWMADQTKKEKDILPFLKKRISDYKSDKIDSEFLKKEEISIIHIKSNKYANSYVVNYGTNSNMRSVGAPIRAATGADLITCRELLQQQADPDTKPNIIARFFGI